MKILATLTSTISLAAIGWGACGIPSANPAAGQELAGLRKAAFKHYQKGQFRDAAAAYTRALRIAEALELNNLATARDLNNLAVLEEEMGAYAEAKTYLLRELELLARLGDAGLNAAGEAHIDLGGLLHIQGHLLEAEASYKKAVALLTHHAGSEDVRTAEALARLGRIYVETGRFQEASSLVTKGRSIAEKKLPAESPKLIHFLDAEAFLLFRTGRVTAAEKKWTTALKIAEHAYGDDAKEYSTLVLHLGQMYSILGVYPAAEAMFTRALAAEAQLSGSDPVNQAIISSSLAGVYSKQGKFAEAEAHFRRSIEAGKADCSGTPLACALVRSNLGEYYMTRKDWGAAKQEFGIAAKLREDTLGEHPLLAESLTSLGRALRKLKQQKEAKICETRANRILSSQTTSTYDANQTVDARALRGHTR